MATSHGAAKRRSQILLDNDLYEGLLQEAEIEGRSISALVREAVSRWLEPRRQRPIHETPFWSLVGSGHSGQSGDMPISENVDRSLYPRPSGDDADELPHPDEPR
jgi:hypothetical protein